MVFVVSSFGVFVSVVITCFGFVCRMLYILYIKNAGRFAGEFRLGWVV